MELSMSATDVLLKHKAAAPDGLAVPAAGAARMRRGCLRMLPVILTVAAVASAAMFGRAMWATYMEAPWTRDGMVRAYVVTLAPEVAGRITRMPVFDNQFVHKGDLLMAIDP